MSGKDGFITPPPGLLPPPPERDGVPQREQIPAAPAGLPRFAPAPATHWPAAHQVERQVSAPTPSWRLVLDDGTEHSIDRATFVGRNPSVTNAAPDAQLLPLVDPAKSLSKTHALLVPALDHLMVTDLHSTNGIAVTAAGGAVMVLEPGRTSPVAPGSRLQFGSFTVTVRTA